MGRAVKQALIATVLSGALVAVAGCMSVAPAPKAEPTVTTTKHRPKLIRTTTTPKITRQKKAIAKKLVEPTEETAPVVVPPLGGGNGGTGGTGGGGGGWG
ncbi:MULTISPECIES: hypothetical protein [unclassified Mesorhizobium]|uniref:hypothetical protein n=1 Tax=unclassified Mesorhizobium TaxID=325217 RepID=UPI001FD93442|nr:MULTISPECIES: hypothetical protein [unclassified Mesorhizobium]